MSDDKNSTDTTHVIPLGESNPMDLIYNRFMSFHTPFGFRQAEEGIIYHPLPYRPQGDEDSGLLLKKPWRLRLELVGDKDGSRPVPKRLTLGVDLYGDIILGRGTSRPGRIILDLDAYGAQQQGVSREHAMIRPTETKLFAIDQGSTNGTIVNGMPSGRGIATVLKNQDLVTLGNFVIMLHVETTPKDAQPPEA